MCLKAKNFCLATIHRAENTDNVEKLSNIFNAFESICQAGHRIVVPIHPRTKKMLERIRFELKLSEKLILIPPVSYLEMLSLENNSKLILTDSGGV
jgi:UDP-N-acetylglucosamine 2-epimerase